MIAAMDEAGVDKSAVVQASTCYGHDNSYLADAVAKYPDRFTGVFSVDVLSPDAPEKMRLWRKKNLTGMRLFTIGSTMKTQADWIDDPKVYPAWETAGELGIPICMQMSAPALPAARQPGAAVPAGEGDPRSPVAAGAGATGRPMRRPPACSHSPSIRASISR